MGFQQGLSGLNASARNLDVIGNNIANANTVGFKQSQAQFSDVFASSLSGSGGLQVGIGTKIGAVAQQFSQGNVTSTNNALDVAVSGQGFFRLDNNGALAYSRNGQFQLDKNGFIVNSQGHKLTGYSASTTGAIITAAPGPLQIPSADLLPKATTAATVGVNLDARLPVPAPVAGVFNPTDPTSYNSSTSMTAYDSLGNPHVTTLYFVKTAANNWNAYMTVDGASVPPTVAPAAPTPLGALTFNTNGTLATPANGLLTSAAFTPAGGAAQTLALNFGTTSQYGSAFGVNQLTQDGYSSGRLSGFNIGTDGIIQARYSNGQAKAVGQIVLANFANAQGLQPIGNNEWVESAAAGTPLVGAPGSANLGILQSASVEDSNVDLTAELVNMITAQRSYQANAQTIKTQDSVLQTIVNLR